MSLKVAAIDAFSTEPLGGNGATVVLLEQPAESLWMQRLAAEFNQSETAFLWSNQGLWYLRWFTPSCEVELCGHATLAASLALHHWQQLPIGTAQQLQTRSGALRVELQSSTSAAIDLPSGGLKPRSKEPWMQPFQPLQQWTSDLGYGVLLLDGSADLQQLNPDDPCWANTSENAWVVMQPGSRGAITSCASLRLAWDYGKTLSRDQPMPWWRHGGANNLAKPRCRDGSHRTVPGASVVNHSAAA